MNIKEKRKFKWISIYLIERLKLKNERSYTVYICRSDLNCRGKSDKTKKPT